MPLSESRLHRWSRHVTLPRLYAAISLVNTASKPYFFAIQPHPKCRAKPCPHPLLPKPPAGSENTPWTFSTHTPHRPSRRTFACVLVVCDIKRGCAAAQNIVGGVDDFHQNPATKPEPKEAEIIAASILIPSGDRTAHVVLACNEPW